MAQDLIEWQLIEANNFLPLQVDAPDSLVHSTSKTKVYPYWTICRPLETRSWGYEFHGSTAASNDPCMIYTWTVHVHRALAWTGRIDFGTDASTCTIHMQPGFSLFYRRGPSSTEWANPPNARKPAHREIRREPTTFFYPKIFLEDLHAKVAWPCDAYSDAQVQVHRYYTTNGDVSSWPSHKSKAQKPRWFEELVCKGEALNSRLHRLFSLLRISSVSQGFGLVVLA